MEQEYLALLFSAMCLMFFGGAFAGMMFWQFRIEDRESSRRFPRPGTEPFRPYRKHPDMLKPPDETKKL
jgi:hypothetical protein